MLSSVKHGKKFIASGTVCHDTAEAQAVVGSLTYTMNKQF